MSKLYPRICSSCGRRFIGKKMDYTCPICIENKPVTIEERNGKIIETRGRRVIGCRSAGYISHT